jgi:hypothetical protein
VGGERKGTEGGGKEKKKRLEKNEPKFEFCGKNVQFPA